MSLLKDIAVSDPICINANDSIEMAVNIFRQHDFDHLPVVDKDGILSGIITKSDLYQKLLQIAQKTSGRNYSEHIMKHTYANDVMITDVVTASVGDSVKDAAQKMIYGDFHALPLVDVHFRVVGIVTAKDLLYEII